MIRSLLSLVVVACVVGCEQEAVVEEPAPQLSDNWKEFARLKSDEGMKSIAVSVDMGYRGGAVQHVKSEKFLTLVSDLAQSAPPSEVTSAQQEELVTKLQALIKEANGVAAGFDERLQTVRTAIAELEQSYGAIKLAELRARPPKPEPPSASRYWRDLFFGSEKKQPDSVAPTAPAETKPSDA